MRIPDDVINSIGLGNRIPTRWRAVRVTRYLCGSCGYLEEWVDRPEDRARIRAKYGHTRSRDAPSTAAATLQHGIDDDDDDHRHHGDN
jgi:hypothetical protein